MPIKLAQFTTIELSNSILYEFVKYDLNYNKVY